MTDPQKEKYYYTQNDKGDIIGLKDATGNTVKTYQYDPFGNLRKDTEKLNFQGAWEQETSQVYNPFGYCGEYFDEETGFVYLRGRYYDPDTERFITEDPMKDGGNWYAYCGNDPVNKIDPSGFKTSKSKGKKTDLSLKKYKNIKDIVGRVYCAWNDTKPQNRISILNNPHNSFFAGTELFIRLAYLKDKKGVDLTKLSVEQIDDIYEVEHFEKIGMISGGVDAAAIISANLAKGIPTIVKTLNGKFIGKASRPSDVFDNLISSANALVKGDNTAVGRAFQKHAVREDTAFSGLITGNPARNTEQGMSYLNKILNDSEATFTYRNTKAFGDVLDVRLPNGMGARWSADGEKFIGFLERYTTR